MVLLDKYGQIVGSDSSSTVSVVHDVAYSQNSSYSALIEGTSQYRAENGMFFINDIYFTSEPGTDHRIQFTTTGIDTSKPSNPDYTRGIELQDIDFKLYIELRECIAGEFFSTSGK